MIKEVTRTEREQARNKAIHIIPNIKCAYFLKILESCFVKYSKNGILKDNDEVKPIVLSKCPFTCMGWPVCINCMIPNIASTTRINGNIRANWISEK